MGPRLASPRPCVPARAVRAATLLLVLALPMATAQALLTDARDDVELERGSPALPEAWAAAIDVTAVWFTDDADGLHAHIQVVDLAAVATTDSGVLQDTFWIAIRSPGYENASGAAARQGTWELRADYRPMDEPAWHFWLERPCLDGRDEDGCAGPDRDIVDGLPGEIDLEASVLRITAPWQLLADPGADDGIDGLWATAQMVWPSYPVYAVDWDVDEGDQCHRFTTPVEERIGTAVSGATGSSHGRSALPSSYPDSDACQAGAPSAEAATTGPTAAPSTTDDRRASDDRNATAGPAVGAPDEESPGVAWLVLLGALLAIVRGRHQSANRSPKAP